MMRNVNYNNNNDSLLQDSPNLPDNPTTQQAILHNMQSSHQLSKQMALNKQHQNAENAIYFNGSA